ncbi:sensor histidine kinase RegB [Oceaniovalibus guishaninsula JLT2003]|uniref:histidine kinase n=1 Tax=Oceaniovalibus guishaninsula JLT2003 TaxID=1231392 RepID=K2HDU4_9RHOB|nr:ActS/PrrB/RegB family redox-sensitive histidine kinase [Oceaniovalibus guishaninsula]EKE44692.1 sensor histidine kinase RegB [Oceaniovalibus guishaninsula JLT2003]
MTQTRQTLADDGALFAHASRSSWVRLRTIVILRWIAIAGQLVVIAVAPVALDLQLHSAALYLTVCAAIVSNLSATFLYPENKRLTELELAWLLTFDMVQLSVLLALSGGLHNPFAVLMLTQVTIGATTLRLRGTVLLGALAVVLVTVLGVWHVNLTTIQGQILVLPDMFLLGFWVALVLGIVFQTAYAGRVTAEAAAMSEALAATQMALAREQKLTDLGGVVAAAAHELGTPLATIALVSGEMLDELRDDPVLHEDARLIREQAERCRLILRSMGRAGKEDLHLRTAPVASVVEEAAEPHIARGKSVLYDLSPSPGSDTPQPVILRRPEIIHGIRNLIQNAVDYAATTVWIDITWSDAAVTLRISDDGPGYPPELLPRLGDPFLRRRREAGEKPRRPHYQGMGLGLFIAKTLLERTGAEVRFANGPDQAPGGQAIGTPGAIVTVAWPRDRLTEGAEAGRPLGENRPMLP